MAKLDIHWLENVWLHHSTHHRMTLAGEYHVTSDGLVSQSDWVYEFVNVIKMAVTIATVSAHT